MSDLKSPHMRELAQWCHENPQPDVKAPEFALWHQRYLERFDEIFVNDRRTRGS